MVKVFKTLKLSKAGIKRNFQWYQRTAHIEDVNQLRIVVISAPQSHPDCYFFIYINNKTQEVTGPPVYRLFNSQDYEEVEIEYRPLLAQVLLNRFDTFWQKHLPVLTWPCRKHEEAKQVFEIVS